MAALNIQKFANAFVTNAQPSVALGGRALDAVERYGAAHGGLWVGGKVTATPDGVRFVPNAVNKALHGGLESAWIPWADVRSVTRQFGWLTGIVVVRHAGGEFRFRCFGAKGVAAEMAAHVAPRAD